ncbi:MAG TPA: DUF1595 domain-containing protein, partial [Polyangiaceae bacterium]|nr:DUF1595 domain-containing protein [Polyangiaceae bacterium]
MPDTPSDARPRALGASPKRAARVGFGSRITTLLGFAGALLAVSACEAHINGDAGQRGGSSSGSSSPLGGMTPEQVLASPMCQTPQPGRAPLRRLSNTEYRNTITDLLGDSAITESLVASATQTFPSETVSLGFRNNADYLGVSDLVAQGYLDASTQFLDSIVANQNLLPCSAASGELDCGTRFIQTFGKLAFRRPLTDAEAVQYAAIFAKALSAYDFDTAVRTTALAFLQSPNFLYRVEYGA